MRPTPVPEGPSGCRGALGARAPGARGVGGLGGAEPGGCLQRASARSSVRGCVARALSRLVLVPPPARDLSAR